MLLTVYEMKRILLSILAIASFSGLAMADEGMWLPALISQRIGDMQAKGFKLSAEDVYSVNRLLLKMRSFSSEEVVLGKSCLTRGCSSQITTAATVLSSAIAAWSMTISKTVSGLWTGARSFRTGD